MPPSTDVRALVRADFGARSATVKVLEKLVKTLQPEAVARLSPKALERVCEPIPAAVVRKALIYFCGERAQLFEMKFAVIVEGGEWHTLELRTAAKLVQKGARAVDPETGERVDPAGTVVYYRGTPRLKRLLKDARA